MSRRAPAAAFILLLAAAAPLAAIDAAILAPAAGTPVFGEVEFEVEVFSDLPPRWVELSVDGSVVARLTAPPYRVRVHLGQANASHRFEVVAEDAAGTRVRRALETPAIRIDDRLELGLRQLYVTVSSDGRQRLDLPREAFSVRDDGVAQKIVTFEGGDVPFTALLLIDASDSMRGRRLELTLAGAHAFVAGMRPLDRASLVLFSDRVLHSTPFTGFAEVLEVGLAEVAAGGGTALTDHLYLAFKRLEERQGRQVLVVLSDGVDVASGLAMGQVMEVARRSPAMVYWLRPGGNARPEISSAWRDAAAYRRERESFERLVAQSGGRVVPLSGVEEAAAAFTEVLQEVRDQVVIGYYPSERRRDGSWHRVAVRVEGEGLRVRVRQGYVDE